MSETRLDSKSFRDYNDFLVEPIETRMEGAPLRGFAFQASGTDPLEPLARSDDERVRNLFMVISELRNDLHLCRTLPEEFPPGDAYDSVRFQFYSMLVGCIINAVNRCLSDIVKAVPNFDQWLSKNLLKNLNNDYASMRDRTKYSFQAFNQVFDLGVTLDINGQGWQNFLSMADVREGLVHPSSLSSLSVSESKIEAFMEGWNWFCTHFPALIDAYSIKSDLKLSPGDNTLFAAFSPIDVVSEIPDGERRDFAAESKKRQAEIMLGMRMPKEFAILFMTVTLATRLYEDCVYAKTDNAAFQLRLSVITSFSAIEARLFTMRKIVKAFGNLDPENLIKVSRQTLGTSVESVDGIDQHLARLNMLDKLQVLPEILAALRKLAWVPYTQTETQLLERYISMRDRVHHAATPQDLQIFSAQYHQMGEAYKLLRDRFDFLISHQAHLLGELFWAVEKR